MRFHKSMAETFSTNLDVEIYENERGETPAAAGQVHPVNRLRRHLSRTITQPRGLLESVVETYGPTAEPDLHQLEASQVEEAYPSLHASDVSDTGTCSSHEDGAEAHYVPGKANDRRKGLEASGGSDDSGQELRMRGRTKSQKLSDEEWAKSILGRTTGYGCLQRNQVVKYIAQLDNYLNELQTKVSTLSPEVGILDQHRWILQGENNVLKQKIAELSQYQVFQEGQNSVLQKEIQLLRMQLQQDEERQNGLSNGGDHCNTNKTHGRSQASSGKLQVQDDDEHSTRHTLQRLPSTLYRSISAIRKDVLDAVNDIQQTPE